MLPSCSRAGLKSVDRERDDAGILSYLLSQFFNRPLLGTFLELTVLRLLSFIFPGFRLFLVLPRVPIVSVLQGVRMRFFIFPIFWSPPSMSDADSGSSVLHSQAVEPRHIFIVVS